MRIDEPIPKNNKNPNYFFLQQIPIFFFIYFFLLHFFVIAVIVVVFLVIIVVLVLNVVFVNIIFVIIIIFITITVLYYYILLLEGTKVLCSLNGRFSIKTSMSQFKTQFFILFVGCLPCHHFWRLISSFCQNIYPRLSINHGST